MWKAIKSKFCKECLKFINIEKIIWKCKSQTHQKSSSKKQKSLNLKGKAVQKIGVKINKNLKNAKSKIVSQRLRIIIMESTKIW